VNGAPGVPAGGPQVWYGDTGNITLGHLVGNAEGTTASAKVRIYTPDSRLRVKVSVLFLRDDPTDTTPVTRLKATLYIGEEEHDYSGKLGSDLICTDVLKDAAGNVIHQSGPLAIPEDDGLDGFSMEFVTAADSLIAIFTTAQGDTEDGIAGPNGHWSMQVRYQPDGQRLCPEDWDWIKRKCHATRVAPEFNLP
jgi:hypothetical protein